MKCRNCEALLSHLFVDLGTVAPSNAYVSPESAKTVAAEYPLQVYVCHHCWLVQTKDFVKAEEMFSADYAYFSSISSSWLKHAEQYFTMITKKLRLTKESYVVEIASNDGYLLKNFAAASIPCLGIEPTIETSVVAKSQGINTLNAFFTKKLAISLVEKQSQADLIVGNNVLAHVPDIQDFVAGLKLLLSAGGTITMEFPHLLALIENKQFDTIYHEHFSYLSLTVVCDIFSNSGLTIFDVDELSTHGGSLRIYACHQGADQKVLPRVEHLLVKETEKGLKKINTYLQFQCEIEKIKQQLLGFLTYQKEIGNSVLAYGAAAKGNTLLNFSGVTPELLPMIFDAAPSKQNMLMPGSLIPIHSPDYLKTTEPDYLLILPWNIADEIKEQLSFLTKTQFLVAIPSLKIYS